MENIITLYTRGKAAGVRALQGVIEPYLPVYVRQRLGREVAQARKEHGLTQVALAEKTGMSQRTLSRLENGHPGVAEEKFFAIARAIGPLKSIFSEEFSPPDLSQAHLWTDDI
ncbi:MULTISPECIES: helix-turn-helix transcriptional regulator [unclassified Corynebacterium]|uniref:helix-turn-helix domain-containing protein n=1 Tax=unclassified Corynebacterium TaxID=2624378 RepID=UPI0029CA5BF5|nr:MULTISPECIES: helix-turn-helix transcriptional regulator [unclassified Corynebacterium]WPF65822.1 helix-turn-helix transcriptional regulator [Corynebacterium sp. 22KM0430]WPF68315.1 helix-turn-helix transcriptional regulator [Corynebacterium sp. 21KM1197]